jgi:hypothetical protein
LLHIVCIQIIFFSRIFPIFFLCWKAWKIYWKKSAENDGFEILNCNLLVWFCYKKYNWIFLAQWFQFIDVLKGASINDDFFMYWLYWNFEEKTVTKILKIWAKILNFPRPTMYGRSPKKENAKKDFNDFTVLCSKCIFFHVYWNPIFKDEILFKNAHVIGMPIMEKGRILYHFYRSQKSWKSKILENSKILESPKIHA